MFRRDDFGGLRHILFTGEKCWLFALPTGPVLKKNNLLWPCFEISCKLAPNVYLVLRVILFAFPDNCIFASINQIAYQLQPELDDSVNYHRQSTRLEEFATMVPR